MESVEKEPACSTQDENTVSSKGDGIPDQIQEKKTLTQDDKEKLKKMLYERQGTAKIKSDFIDFEKIHLKYGFVIEPASQGNDGDKNKSKEDVQAEASAKEPPKKKIKKERGMNHNRPRNKWIPMSEKLCPMVIIGEVCRYGNKCNFSHDLAAKAATRPPDIGDRCYNFATFGKCRYGVVCRFGSSHLAEDFTNIVDREKFEASANMSVTRNNMPADLKVKLRKKKMKFEKADKFLSTLARYNKNLSKVSTVSTVCNKDDHSNVMNIHQDEPAVNIHPDEPAVNIHQDEPANKIQTSANANVVPDSTTNDHPEATGTAPTTTNQSADSISMVTQPTASGAVTDQDAIKLRKSERKQLNFEGKSYLAPLTTVGNLPFRRVCKRLGADITCSEMAMVTNILQGQTSELALLKRHSSEDFFGIQLAGYFPDTISKCSELIGHFCDVDFVDLNVGCPIDLVYQKGGGSGLMSRVGRFEEIVRGMDAVLDVPVTVKMRTGISEKHSVAQKLIPKIYDWGASLVTLHGRSREQRYTKTADWNYIRQCVEVAKPHPLIGNGDILSYEDINTHLKNSGAAGVMIARGALIKPWIFTEIKEQRHWDISSNERLDILKEYTNYGMEHWGSDTEGIEKTRRFLLEWLSFLHRYIPVGLLERLPQKIQERPPYYVGRNDLETLMSSTNCADWIKISEMLLGPVPDVFQFLPKHKANSYS